MKAAIITLHRIYNYGSALQAYATQEIFRAMGHEAVVIHYITPQRTFRRTFFGNEAVKSRGLLGKAAYYIPKAGSILLKELTFGRFVRKKLNLTKKYITAQDLDRDPPEADLYVTGSDQTWNSVYNEGIDRGFFLDFIPEDRPRIAFVSSFGMEKLPEAEVERTKHYLSRYSGLSVREDSAQRILLELGRTDAVQLIDPTLQIPKQKWVQMASRRLIREPYVLLFLLYNEDDNATAYARRIARERGLKVVKLSWEMKRPAGVDVLMTHRAPEEFLSLMHHADFVVTNSFHGLAFSINLEKQFIVVPRREFNSRIESLLRLTGLQGRMVSSEERLAAAGETIDYGPVGQVLEREREKAKAFLNTYAKAERP